MESIDELELPDLAVETAGKVTSRPFPGVWGIRSLPIEIEPAPAC